MNKPEALIRRYEALLTSFSDIRSHLPMLAKLASECPVVTEFGVRDGNSTTALLYGQPEKLYCVDIQECPVIEELQGMAGRTELSFWQGDSREAEVRYTDLLFIDSTHDSECLSAELKRHAGAVTKYIALHDTQTSVLMLPALHSFLSLGMFQLYHHSPEDYGFTVLVKCS